MQKEGSLTLRYSIIITQLCKICLPRCDFVSEISHLLLVLNSSTNLLVYCWKDKKFRKVLMSKLGMPDSQLYEVNWENVTKTR